MTARRYVAWLRRHLLALFLGHAVVLAGALYLIAWHLPLRADFSYLLPQDAPSVRDLRRLEARVKATETVLVVVEAETTEARAAAVAELVACLRGLPRDLVDEVRDDDLELRRFVRAHLHVFVSLEDLVTARDALAGWLAAARLAGASLPAGFRELERSWHDAQGRLARSSHVSADGRIALVEIRLAFRGTDADRGAALIDALEGVRAHVEATHPRVGIGLTGGIITGVAEQRSITSGIVVSSLVTALLVGCVLALFFRSARLVALLVCTIAIATAEAFGAAAISIGHLNAATAFLGAIIAGNGVNYGILLIARFREERRRADVDGALVAAIAGTLKPTAIASLGAAIAYGSLAATSFKGFADFAVLGAVGMAVCWIESFVLLPALVLALGRGLRADRGDSPLGELLARGIGRLRPRQILGVAIGLGLVATVVVVRYVAADPFEYDIKHLRSESDEAIAIRRWMTLSDETFGRGFANRMYIGAERPDQVPQIVAALRGLDAGKPPEARVVGPIRSILDLVPDRQDEKLAVLAQIRALIDDAVTVDLDPDDRAVLRALRPPAGAEPITIDTLPPSIRTLPEITEADGRTGLMISIYCADRLDDWNGHDLIEFASAVRRLRLPDGETVTTSGASVIFVDILETIERDGPRVTALAAAGLVVMVLLVVGRNRRAVAVLAATGLGSLVMVAICAVVGLKVTFLDFVALPIALGLGIDYAINIAYRHDELDDPCTTLRTSGSAVVVCSLTTMIGYGSLLVSDNLTISGFGAASLIGEITCVLTALLVVPAILGTQSGTRR